MTPQQQPTPKPQPPHRPEDEPIRLAPDEDDPSDPRTLRHLSLHRPEPEAELIETPLETDAIPFTTPLKGGSTDPASMSQTLQWALDAMEHPALAAADWLARDIDPNAQSATTLLTDPAITLQQVRQAKAAFKTMRIVGEKAADRRIGARMYAAAIAAGLVRHRKRISSQSDAALKRGFQALLDDRRMPQPLRDLAGMALCVLSEMTQSKSA